MITLEGSRGARASLATEPIRVLFMQSQTYFGADSQVHAALMRRFDRRDVQAYVAFNRGAGQSPAFRALATIPDLMVRPVNFGPSLDQRSPTQLAGELLRTGLPGLRDLVGLARFVRRERIQIVHCTEKPRDAFYGLLVARMGGARSVVHLHVKAEDWLSPLVKWSMRRADLLLAISDYVASSMVDMGLSADRIAVTRNALDVDAWDPATDGRPVRRELHLPDDVPVVAILARVFYWKGHLPLLRALAKLRDRTDFRLVVAGDDDARGAPGRPGLTADLRNLARELGIADRVVFTGHRSDAQQMLAACDVFAMPSHEEPFGMVYLEAMAMERPVVAFASGGASEVVDDGRTGLLAPDGDIDVLAAHLFTLLRDPELRRTFGRAGRIRVRREFAPERMVGDVLRAYRRVAQPRA